MQNVNEKLKSFKTENQSKSNEEFKQTLQRMGENLNGNDPSMQTLQGVHDKLIDRIQTKEGCSEKYFRTRNSLLTDLVELPHINAIRNILVVIVLSMFVHALVTDLIERNTVTLRLGEGFTNIHMAAFTWICMFTSTVAVYCAFVLWAGVRVHLINNTKIAILQMWDTIWLLLFVVYIFSLFYFTIKSIIDHSLDIFVSQTVTIEMNRMFMKLYAFVRSNTPRVLKHQPHGDDKLPCPSFSEFIYFLFAPTLVYRDSYPRTSHIRWNYVVLYCAEVYAGLFCMHFIQEYIHVPSFQHYNLKNITVQDFIILMSQNAISNLFCWLSMVFVLFHASQNLFAELLRFGDRLFYKDWWNTDSASKFYATFSVVVYDWGSIYIYRDLYGALRKNAVIAKTVEVLLIVVLHEFVYSIGYRFYYSILPVNFVVGFIVLTHLPKSYFLANTIFLHGLIAGITLLRTGLTLEYYVRLSCPVENASLLSYFVPRTFTCSWQEGI